MKFEKLESTYGGILNIAFGSVWEDEIEDAMLDSDVMLVVMSQQAASSDEIKNEWRYWLKQLNRPIVTLILEECRLPYRLFPRQHIYANNRPNEIIGAELVAAIMKSVTLSRASMPTAKRDEDEVLTSVTDYVSINLDSIHSQNIADQLQRVTDLGYVPNRYARGRFATRRSDYIGSIYKR